MNFAYKVLGRNTGISSKRFISVAGFIVLTAITFINMFTGLTVSDTMFNGLVMVTIGALGSTAAESFGKYNTTDLDIPPTVESLPKTTKSIKPVKKIK